MTNKESIQQESYNTETKIILHELPNSELLATLERIGSLHSTLCRLASCLDEDAIEAIIMTQIALKKINREIVQVLTSRYMRNNHKALQTWENEGGRVVYASV